MGITLEILTPLKEKYLEIKIKGKEQLPKKKFGNKLNKIESYYPKELSLLRRMH
jgi:hypothetical protein